MNVCLFLSIIVCVTLLANIASAINVDSFGSCSTKMLYSIIMRHTVHRPPNVMLGFFPSLRVHACFIMRQISGFCPLNYLNKFHHVFVPKKSHFGLFAFLTISDHSKNFSEF